LPTRHIHHGYATIEQLCDFRLNIKQDHSWASTIEKVAIAITDDPQLIPNNWQPGTKTTTTDIHARQSAVGTRQLTTRNQLQPLTSTPDNQQSALDN
jgi:hypothetical protein